MWEEIAGLVWTILLIAVVLALAYAFTRFVAGRAAGSTGLRYRGRRLTVLEQVNVGKEQKLLLVRMGEKYYFLGAAPGGISCLEQVSPEEAERWKEEAESGQDTPPTIRFQDALREVVERRRDRGGS